MIYRGVEYTLVKGIERQVWKWGFELNGKAVGGQSSSREQAIKHAERAIEKEFSPRKVRLVRPS